MTVSEMSGLDVAIGMLSRDQVATQLPFGDAADPVLLVDRLIARKSLPAVQIGGPGGEWKVPLDGLKAFINGGATVAVIRKGYNLPEETLSPILPIKGSWFDTAGLNYFLDVWTRDMMAEMERQRPKTLTQAGNVEFSVQNTTELQAIIGRAAPEKNVAQTRDWSVFKNMAEIYLTTALQGCARRVLSDRANSNLQDIGSYSVRELYASNAAYLEIVGESQKLLAGGALFFSKVFPALDPLDPRQIGGRRLTVTLPYTGIMTAAGTELARLACLAF